jgi:hypothetical protein
MRIMGGWVGREFIRAYLDVSSKQHQYKVPDSFFTSIFNTIKYFLITTKINPA